MRAPRREAAGERPARSPLIAPGDRWRRFGCRLTRQGARIVAPIAPGDRW